MLPEGAEMSRPPYDASRFPPPTERAGKEGLQCRLESAVVATWRINLKCNFDSRDFGGQMKSIEVFLLR